MTTGAPSVARRSSGRRDFRFVMLLAALASAILIQFLLARLLGSSPGAARNDWSVALSLFAVLTLSGGFVIWALWLARGLQMSWAIGLAVAAAGLLMRGPFFGAGPMLEDDHYRYLLDGAMGARGLNPYAYAPEVLLSAAPPQLVGLVEAGRGVIERINFPDLRSIYPGTAQALFALAHWLSPWTIDGLRSVILLAEIASAFLIWLWLRQNGAPALGVGLYWCNPLMAFCLTGQAHIDAALAPAVLLALLALRARRAIPAGIGLGLAVGIKLWPLLLAPMVMRVLWPDHRRVIAFLMALGSVALLTCGPLLWASLSAKAGLTAYAGGWSINNALFAWLSFLFLHLFGPGLGEMILRGGILALAAAVSLHAGLRGPRDPTQLAGHAAMLAALLFYLSPAQFPWYAAWFLPLAAAGGAWILAFGAIGLPVYFLFFPLAAMGLRDLHGYGLAALHLFPLLAALALRHRWLEKESIP